MIRTKDKINSAQLRVVLDHLGIPFNHQPVVAGDRRSLLNKFSQVDPQGYKTAYDIVVNKILPENATQEQKEVLDFSIALDEAIRFAQAKSTDFVRTEFSYHNDEIKNQIKILSDLIRNAESTIEERAEKAIEKASKKFRNISVTVNNTETKNLVGFTAPKEFDQLIQLAAQRKNILMVGPAGCGKTFIAGKIAEALGLDFSSQSCSAGMSESLLTGWLLPTGDNGKFEYVSSEFVRIYENGGIFLFDEIDASDPNVLIFINQAIANGSFFLPQRYNKPQVKKHKDFIAVAAANTFGNGADMQYVGRNQLDAATLDRFKIGTVPMNYDNSVEESLIDPKVLEWGRSIRSNIARQHLNRIMSTRVLIDATDMLRNQKWTIDQISESYFSDWSKDEKRILGVK